MRTNDSSRLEQLASEHGVQMDTLRQSVSLDERGEMERDLRKAANFRTRDMDERADEIERDVLSRLGIAGDDPDDPGGDGPATDTLSRDEVVDLLGDEFDMDTLNSPWRIDEERERIEHKETVFRNRGMDDRADTLARQAAALEAIKSEVQASPSGERYSLDTLASRATSDGLVIEFDGTELSTRPTGGAR